MNKPCFFCGKDDWPTEPTIYYATDDEDEDPIKWICQRHLWNGSTMINAFTGMPICMVGFEEENSREILKDE